MEGGIEKQLNNNVNMLVDLIIQTSAYMTLTSMLPPTSNKILDNGPFFNV